MTLSKQVIKKIPLVKTLARLFRKLFKSQGFPGSADYWESRYQNKGTSGAGSYNRLAEFKSEVINLFVTENNIKSVIEFGCGDGNQLALAKYPQFIGLDVSKTAVKLCADKFAGDTSKSFFLYDTKAFVDNCSIFTADAALSLDVIFHLVEDDVFNAYMAHLFGAAQRFVIIYSSNYQKEQTFHEKDRNFTSWIDDNAKGWALYKKIDNKYKFNPADPDNTSKSDFYIYRKM